MSPKCPIEEHGQEFAFLSCQNCAAGVNCEKNGRSDYEVLRLKRWPRHSCSFKETQFNSWYPHQFQGNLLQFQGMQGSLLAFMGTVHIW